MLGQHGRQVRRLLHLPVPRLPCVDVEAQATSNGWHKAATASVAADSRLVEIPSASVAERGNAPIKATVPGPAVSNCQVSRP